MAIRNDPIDLEAFRLRRFLDLLRDEGGLKNVSEHIDLVDIGSRLDGNPKAVLFQNPGPDGKSDLPVVGNVLGAAAGWRSLSASAHRACSGGSQTHATDCAC